MGRVRPFIGGDLLFLHVIDVQGYEEPWTQDEIKKHSRDMFTATVFDTPSGYAAVETVSHQVKLLRLVVARERRREKLGSYLMEAILKEYHTYTKLTTIVTESNLGAQLFCVTTDGSV